MQYADQCLELNLIKSEGILQNLHFYSNHYYYKSQTINFPF